MNGVACTKAGGTLLQRVYVVGSIPIGSTMEKNKKIMKKIVLTGEFESSKVRLRDNSVKILKVARKSVLSRLLKKLKSSK